MSTRTYDELWKKTMFDLLEIIDIQQPPPEFAGGLKKMSPEQKFQQLKLVYLKTLSAYKALNEVNDMTLHAQKRLTLAMLLQGIMGRILELRKDLVKFQGYEVIFFDDLCLDNQKTFDYTDVDIPLFVKGDRADEVTVREEHVRTLCEKFGIPKEIDFFDRHCSVAPAVVPLTPDEAILLIQTAERGRQGRYRSLWARDVLEAQDFSSSMTPDSAALLIQHGWNRYLAQMEIKAAKVEELYSLGMRYDEKAFTSEDPVIVATEKARRDRILRKQKQHEVQKEFELAKEQTKKNLEVGREQEVLKESYQDRFHSFVAETLAKTNKLPESIDEFKKAIDPDAGKQEEAPEDSKKKKGNAKGGKKPAKAKSKNEEEDVAGPSPFESAIVHGTKEYFENWQVEFTEHDIADENTDEHYDRNMIKAELLPAWEAQVKEQMMEVLTRELAELKLELKLADAKLSKKKKKGKKKGKKKAKKQKAKKTKVEEPTVNVFARLVNYGHIKPLPELHIEDFCSGFDENAETAYKVGNVQPPPTNLVVSSFIEALSFPIGSALIRSNPKIPRKLFLYGPNGVGKRTLLYTIANELGAIVINIANEIIVEQYTSKTIVGLFSDIAQIARDMGPTIILIDEAEKVWFNKKSKKGIKGGEIMKKMKKEIANLFSKQGHLPLMLVSISAKPANLDPEAISTSFDRTFYLPIPNYQTQYMLWEKYVSKFAKKPKHQIFSKGTEITSLLSITRKTGLVTGANIKRICQDTFTKERIDNLTSQSFSISEFAEAMSKQIPFTSDDFDEFTKFTSSLPYKMYNPEFDEDDTKDKKKKPKPKK
eukprot:TRINITY_DN2943_c0_g1_i1.p1 TRINITY_DN2943_c0_g1~~TRINITY_DN2943_c0_g1_i1.p1  ORF type:complete len:821 (+),score=163.67 TRINITY_DN2943_c0_g1_i1:1062-3524(+)